MEPEYPLKGLHHITLVSGHAERTARFYVNTLGLTFVKKTVNFDRPETYHLYFGDETGTPGTLVTFFVWPDAQPGQVGIGVTHHFALTVESTDALLKWKTYLQHQHIMVAGPYRQEAYSNIIFVDPEGVQLELATRGPGWDQTHDPNELYIPPRELQAPFRDEEAIELETWPEPITEITPDMRIQGLHHVSPVASDIERTNDFYHDVLGIPLLRKSVDTGAPTMPRWYWSTAPGGIAGLPGSLVTYFSLPKNVPPIYGHVGKGVTHHFAFEVESDEAQQYWRERLVERGLLVTPVMDRKYFRSIYFEDPDGQILEIATTTPGFLIDEPKERLGQDLMLPASLEPRRQEIEAALPPISLEKPLPAR
jgi:glyoxalase family protein